MILRAITSTDIQLNIGSTAVNAALPSSGTTFGPFVAALLTAALSIGALLVLFYLIWGAFEWITSGGDSSKVQKGRDKITQAVIGLIVLASTIAIFNLMQQFLGIQVLDTSTTTSGSGGTPAMPAVRQIFQGRDSGTTTNTDTNVPFGEWFSGSGSPVGTQPENNQALPEQFSGADSGDSENETLPNFSGVCYVNYDQCETAMDTRGYGPTDFRCERDIVTDCVSPVFRE